MDFTLVSLNRNFEEIAQLLKKKKFTLKTLGPSQIQVTGKDDLKFQADLILAETDYQDWVVQRALPVEIFAVMVPICSAEDLIILKLIANRRQDLLDIENVLKNEAARLDRGYLQRWFVFWELEKRFQKEFGKLL